MKDHGAQMTSHEAHEEPGLRRVLRPFAAGTTWQHTWSPRRFPRWVLAAVLVLWAAAPSAQTPSPSRPVFRTETELVLVNIVVRDKSGNVVRGLTRNDFIITEDDKPQTITSFDFEELDTPDATPPPDT